MIGSSNLPGQLQTLFTVVLHITSDTWKRFVHDHGTYQCKLLCLAACTSLSEFVVLWDQYQEARAMCPTCMDSAFSERLLSGFPKELAKQPLEIQESTYNTVVSILDDLCMHCPVSRSSILPAEGDELLAKGQLQPKNLHILWLPCGLLSYRSIGFLSTPSPRRRPLQRS